MKVMS